MPQTVTFGPPVITVDVEDWPQSTWDRTLPVTERAATNTRILLELLEQCGVRATMFVLGKFAEAFPAVVREIHEQGHEVASHGHGHVEIFKQSRQEFAADVRRSKDHLEQIIGSRIAGYRAPDFSVVTETLWALEALAEAGFEYDSSVFPIAHARYGIPKWPVAPVRVALPKNQAILEVPLATYRFMTKNWPVGGGGYHRLLPGFMFRYLAKSVMTSAPFIFYCHPYEHDTTEFANMAVRVPLHVRLHQGLGRGRVRTRLETFLRRFGGRRIKDLVASSDWPKFDPYSGGLTCRGIPCMLPSKVVGPSSPSGFLAGTSTLGKIRPLALFS
jgi:polysaccharide deacetylase family protein (PEP-CTERM system associated)